VRKTACMKEGAVTLADNPTFSELLIRRLSGTRSIRDCLQAASKVQPAAVTYGLDQLTRPRQEGPTVATPLRLLILDDNPSDAGLVLHTLRYAGYAPIAERVETEQDFRDGLQLVPDIILADFSMPQFDSLSALSIMQEKQLDIPFIIVSGTIGEERAVQAMQRGAADYVIKDRLGRLGHAVANALEKKTVRHEKQLAERRLAAQHAITQALAALPTLAEAGCHILRAICQGLAWDFGALWHVDKCKNELRCVGCWRSPLAPAADNDLICPRKGQNPYSVNLATTTIRIWSGTDSPRCKLSNRPSCV
jgi:DNA-binding NarL/FixJ family response regulator